METSAELGFAVSVHVRMNRMSEPENASIIALLEPASAVVFAAIILKPAGHVKRTGGWRADTALVLSWSVGWGRGGLGHK